jgi:hypothetical protein
MRNRPDATAFAIRLRYLVTPWSGSPLLDQRMLGRVLRALHEQPVLTTAEPVALTLLTPDLAERTRLWRAAQRPYRLSLHYEARGIVVDSGN